MPHYRVCFEIAGPLMNCVVVEADDEKQAEWKAKLELKKAREKHRKPITPEKG